MTTNSSFSIEISVVSKSRNLTQSPTSTSMETGVPSRVRSPPPLAMTSPSTGISLSVAAINSPEAVSPGFRSTLRRTLPRITLAYSEYFEAALAVFRSRYRW